MGGASTVSVGADLTGRIRRVIREHGHLPVEIETIADDTDLFQAGMTSHASVNLMLGLEAEFDVEFPDAMLKRSVFQSVSAIRAALSRLMVAAA
jgi:acyl carrier protein